MKTKHFHGRAACPVRSYTLVEMISALGLLAILSACFFASLNTLRKMEVLFEDENRAVLALDNTLERLEAAGLRSPPDLERIFRDEFKKSGLDERRKIRLDFKLEDGSARMAVLTENGKTLATARVKCAK